jgi:DNA-binding NarL/FixJ family response regulator
MLNEYLFELTHKPGSAEVAEETLYLRKLITAFTPDGNIENEESPSAIVFPSPDSRLTDPLSSREIEVLTMLLSGKTVKEVAINLTIAVNTAKAHVRSIYRKLDVHTRKAVFQRAKELGLNLSH